MATFVYKIRRSDGKYYTPAKKRFADERDAHYNNKGRFMDHAQVAATVGGWNADLVDDHVLERYVVNYDGELDPTEVL